MKMTGIITAAALAITTGTVSAETLKLLTWKGYAPKVDGSTPLINAISFVLIVSTSILALINLLASQRQKTE